LQSEKRPEFVKIGRVQIAFGMQSLQSGFPSKILRAVRDGPSLAVRIGRKSG